jgi:hypothetical protein
MIISCFKAVGCYDTINESFATKCGCVFCVIMTSERELQHMFTGREKRVMALFALH